jgi:hypothetical protein
VEHLLGLTEDRQVTEHTERVAIAFCPPQPKSIEEWEEMYKAMEAARARKDYPNAEKDTPDGEVGTHQEE